MADISFYKNYGPHSLSFLAKNLDCDVWGDKNFLIHDISPISISTSRELTFFSNKRYINDFEKTKAGACIVEEKYISDKTKNYIVSDNPYFTFAEIAMKFYPDSIYPNFYYEEKHLNKNFNKSLKLSKNSFIHNTAKIGKNVVIGVNTFIGPSVEIGDNCIIGDNVSIYYSILKNNVKIFSGTKIGSEGFGFAINGNKFMKIPQIGRVIIHENVEIACNCAIDRGSLGDTIIGKNSMIDNLVHIAHNVVIGNNCIIAGQVGISGSTNIGNHVVMGGQVGISGHIKIANNVKIAAQSGIMKNVSEGESIGGYPAVKIRDWHKSTLFLKSSIKKKK